METSLKAKYIAKRDAVVENINAFFKNNNVTIDQNNGTVFQQFQSKFESLEIGQLKTLQSTLKKKIQEFQGNSYVAQDNNTFGEDYESAINEYIDKMAYRYGVKYLMIAYIALLHSYVQKTNSLITKDKEQQVKAQQQQAQQAQAQQQAQQQMNDIQNIIASISNNTFCTNDNVQKQNIVTQLEGIQKYLKEIGPLLGASLSMLSSLALDETPALT